MDSQDPRRNHTHTSGHENHACHKCGWPFPNPHPSARHRRAHKKHCGTIEGYKLVDSEETSHLAVSDDEHVSDEDPKTPSPKVMERSGNENGSGEIGDKSNRFEDEVFTDAVAEFSVTGSGSGTGERLKDAKEPEVDLGTINTSTFQSTEDGVITVTSTPPSNSADTIQMQNTEVSVNNQISEEALDHDSNAITGFMGRSLTDFKTEESGREHNNDNRGSACDSIPIKLETQTDASKEIKKTSSGEDLLETHTKGDEGTELDGQLPDVVVLTNENAGEASEVASKSWKIEDVNSQHVPSAEVLQLKERHTLIDAAEVTRDAGQGMDSASCINSTEDNYSKGEGNESVHVLTVPDYLPVVANAENMIKGFKDQGGKLPQLLSTDLFEVYNNNSRLLIEEMKVSAADVDALDDDREPKDVSSDFIVKELHDEAEVDMSQSSRGVRTNAAASDLGNNLSVKSSEEELPYDHCETSSVTNSLELAARAISDTLTVVVPMDVEVSQINNLVGMDDTGNYGKDKMESSEISVNDKNKRNTEEGCSENRAPTSEHYSIVSEQVDQKNSVLGYVSVGGHHEGKIPCDVSEIETTYGSASGLREEHLLREPKTTPVSGSYVNESCVTSKNEITVFKDELLEPECTNVGRVSDTQESRKDGESNIMVNSQFGLAGEDNTAAKSDSGGDVEVLWKSSEDKILREPLISPTDTSSFIQNFTSVAHSHAGDSVAVTSGNRSKSVPIDGDNNFAAQEVAASANDFSVDSSSQTDSLEGHWGSVSVLSTQSDAPAINDAEPLPSNGSQALSEAEKANLMKPRTASETAHGDKSDIFEPPSFMTLVEPRDGVDQKAAASEIQTKENPQQAKAAALQAGWFPSITDVVNESQGRKNNEEIIAKVTKWSTGKQHPPLKSQQHTPLKNLLGEATMETESKSSNTKENPVEKDDSLAKDNGSFPKTGSSILVPQAPVNEPVKKEEEKAWSSPARYTADIKREKRKVKGRPYWAQFVCCSSVN